MTIKNEKLVQALSYYGLHMVPGVAEYAEPLTNDGEPYRILIGEDCLRQMDATFKGRPVYVEHVDEVNPENVEQLAVGYVVESFFNKTDGNHWAKFLITDTAGKEAIDKGYRLSNAYMPKQFGPGGKWHNVDYLKEVEVGEYEHLAQVPNPRYEESIVLTPEEFKAYNLEKELELSRLANSKGDNSMGLKFWKKTKLENSADLESTVVTLKSGTEKSITQLVNDAEMAEEHKKNEEKEKAEGKVPMANGDHKVKVGDDEMTVNELVEKYTDAMSKMNGEDDDAENDDDDMEVEKKDDDKDDESALDKAKNEESEDKTEKKDAKKNSVDAKAKKKENFNKLKNAEANATEPEMVELSSDRFARGKERYGS